MYKTLTLTLVLFTIQYVHSQNLTCIPSGAGANMETISITTDCGDYFGRSLSGLNSFNDDYSCTSGNTWIGAEYIFKITDVVKGTYTFSIADFATDLDMFILSSCNESTCLSSDGARRSSGREESATIDLNDGQTVYVVVDGKFVNSAAFTFSIICSNDICEDINRISCGNVVTNSNTSYDRKASDKVDDHASCGGGSYTQHEVIYMLKTSNSPITVDLYPFDKRDIDLFVYDDCISGLSNCLAASTISPFGESVFLASGGSDSETYIVIDGKTTQVSFPTSGTYKLAVTCGEPCDQKPEKINCNSVTHSTTKGKPNNASYYSCDGAHDKGHNWGPEALFEFEIDDEYDIEINLDIHNNSDLNLYLLKSSCSVTSCIESSKSEHPGKTETIKEKLKKGKYIIVVEGFRGSSGDFTLSLFGCGCKIDGEIECNEPINGTLSGATNSFTSVNGDCFGQEVSLDNEDRLYYFIAPEDADYVFSLSGFSYGMDLFLTEDCADPNRCIASATSPGTETEIIEISLDKNQQVIVAVDGLHDFQNSKFKLEVSCIENETPPVDDDGTIEDDENNDEPNQGEEDEEEGDLGNDENDEEAKLDTLLCGQVLEGSTRDMPSIFKGSDYSCFISNYDFNGGESIVPLSKDQDSDILAIHVFHGNHYHENLSLFVMDEDLNEVPNCKGLNFRADKTIGNGMSIGEYYTDAANPLPAGNYYAVLDGYNQYVASEFELALTCGRLDCHTALGLPCGEALVPENTKESTNNESIYRFKDETFIGYTGGENVYSFCLDSTQTIDITLYGLFKIGEYPIDLDMFLFSGPCGSEEMLDFSRNEGSADENIKIELPDGQYYLVVDGWRGSRASFSLRVSDCFATSCPKSHSRDKLETSIHQKIYDEGLSVYPNPFRNHIFLELPNLQYSLSKLEIYDQTGRLLKVGELALSKGSIDISRFIPDVENGLYLLRLVNGPEVFTRKIVKW